MEVETRENLNSIHLEGNNVDDYYNSQEIQHLQQQEEYESEDYEEEPPLEEPQNTVDYVQEPNYQNTVDEYVQEPVHQNTVEYVQEPVSTVEEPVSEPVKFTYASIVRNSLLFSIYILVAIRDEMGCDRLTQKTFCPLFLIYFYYL